MRWGVVAESALAGGLDKGTAGDRYQVIVHVDADTLAAGAEDGERSTDGAATAPPERIRRGRGRPATEVGRTRPATRAGDRPHGPYVPAGTYGPCGAAPGSTDEPSPERGAWRGAAERIRHGGSLPRRKPARAGSAGPGRQQRPVGAR